MADQLFAPILKSTQDVITKDLDYKIHFNISNLVSSQSIGHVQMKVVGFTTNKNLIKSTLNSPNGFYYQEYEKNKNFITLRSDMLIDGWKPGELYKIQLRFGKGKLWGDNLNNFSKWFNSEKESFSEWSNVMIVKVISRPNIEIQNSEAQDSIGEKIETTLTPLFQGLCSFVPEEKEVVKSYKYDLYLGDALTSNNLLESSGWLPHFAANKIDEYRFKTYLEDGKIYSIKYDILSNNGYNSEEEIYPLQNIYTFVVRKITFPEEKNLTLVVNDRDIDCIEEGRIKIYLTSKTPVSGIYVLTRSSEKDNFKIWEDLSAFSFLAEKLTEKLIYCDYSIESNVKYKYAIQRQSSSGLRSSLIEPIDDPTFAVNFEYTYLYNKDKQLKLKFDTKLSSFKHSVLANKTDTLGSKFPTILRNGNAYYATFPISGLISFQSDENNTFLDLNHEPEYLKPIYVREGSVIKNENDRIPDTQKQNLTFDNIAKERIFRNKVEEFLNNGEYKLYKSETEGNMIVALMNVSLTPNETLGRMIYEFSAEAYEMADNTLENLKYYDIIESNNLEDFFKKERSQVTFGQLQGYYFGSNDEHEYDNLIERIKKQVSYNLGGDYIQSFDELISLEIEAYPDIDFELEIPNLQQQKEEALNKKDIVEYNRLSEIVDRKEVIKEQIKNAPSPLKKIIFITGDNATPEPIIIMSNRKYCIKDNFKNPLIEDFHLEESGLIVINYVCKTKISLDESLKNANIESTTTWGRIAQEFNENLNILALIKQKSKEEVESKYDALPDYIPEMDIYHNDTTYNIFKDLDYIEIEAERQTILLLTNLNGKLSRITLGPTQKYTLKPSQALVKELSFEYPTYATIDYKYSTIQLITRNGGN